VVVVVGLVLVAVCLGRTSGVVDAQDAFEASPVASAIVASVTPITDTSADEQAAIPTMTVTPEIAAEATATASTAPSSISTPESTPTATPSPQPVDSPAGIDAIEIEVRSADGAVGPGGSVTYHFRLTNTSNAGVQLWLLASLDRGGWTVAIVEADGMTSLNQPISLDSGQGRDVSVIVFAPVDAVVGEQATLRLTAVDAEADASNKAR
jgi:hypothetical protein